MHTQAGTARGDNPNYYGFRIYSHGLRIELR